MTDELRAHRADAERQLAFGYRISPSTVRGLLAGIGTLEAARDDQVDRVRALIAVAEAHGAPMVSAAALLAALDGGGHA